MSTLASVSVNSSEHHVDGGGHKSGNVATAPSTRKSPLRARSWANHGGSRLCWRLSHAKKTERKIHRVAAPANRGHNGAGARAEEARRSCDEAGLARKQGLGHQGPT